MGDANRRYQIEICMLGGHLGGQILAENNTIHRGLMPENSQVNTENKQIDTPLRP